MNQGRATMTSRILTTLLVAVCLFLGVSQATAQELPASPIPVAPSSPAGEGPGTPAPRIVAPLPPPVYAPAPPRYEDPYPAPWIHADPREHAGWFVGLEFELLKPHLKNRQTGSVALPGFEPDLIQLPT